MSKNSGIVIRQMTEDDVPALVDLHLEVFKGYDNTMMGVGYLTNLYRTLACHSACISIVALEDGKLAGWIGGVWDWLSFQKALVRRNILGTPLILLSILKNKPAMIAKAFSFVWSVVLEFVRRSKRPEVPREGTAASRAAALLVIGVKPRSQNQGVGQSMMEGFEGLILSKGFTGISLSTATDNEAGNRVFQKAGYVLYRTNGGVNYYSKHLTKKVGA